MSASRGAVGADNPRCECENQNTLLGCFLGTSVSVGSHHCQTTVITKLSDFHSPLLQVPARQFHSCAGGTLVPPSDINRKLPAIFIQKPPLPPTNTGSGGWSTGASTGTGTGSGSV
ncbi:hypothetical protein RvY_18921 [Ramazzottius varieornatus]|uniref:Uncharacterized protein n=1 Tax=Ramazzottius varieornatus TaxID=947166 RepID=A0A1D1WBX1_RAMVA|nr:hypothetical protein RvY_18921 [Ramazzottius varieornatus]